MARQTSEGKRGVRSSSIKQSRANRGGMREMPPTRQVGGAYGTEGRDRKTPPRARAAGEVPKARRPQGRKRAA